ncbi:hypothetical protein EJ02DRAFT_408380 [Clathrospora elynae]|uniref:Uncharacterized protein n=1 Tax=Clathrospora elynae TaxID=706981 RepID=A0A6A5SJF1_9PLEO|nr:hypothetical protein EJ02DRAFT_408380 [Clathrospora elynae]
MKFLSLLLIVPLVSARVVRYLQQIPITEEGDKHAATIEELETRKAVVPGVGVHFTTSYAVAAARHQNGTRRDLVRIDGDAYYTELMSRWMDLYSSYEWWKDCDWIATVPANQFTPQRWRCNWQKVDRGMRSLLGLPASRDVAVLSTFLSKVRSAIETELAISITHIAPTTFPLLPAQKKDFSDAFALSGLTSTRTRPGDSSVIYPEANTAYAGLGHGLCEESTDHSSCSSSEKSISRQHIFVLNLGNSSFSASIYYLRTAYEDARISTHRSRSNLGWWDLPVFEVPRASFWAELRELVVDVASGMQYPPGRIVVMGEHGCEEEFKKVVEEALWSVWEVDVGMLLKPGKAEDADMLAARGAAELAWQHEYSSRGHVDSKMAAGNIEL